MIPCCHVRPVLYLSIIVALGHDWDVPLAYCMSSRRLPHECGGGVASLATSGYPSLMKPTADAMHNKLTAGASGSGALISRVVCWAAKRIDLP